MSTLRIYKNGELKSMFGFSSDYERFKELHGYYSSDGLLVILLKDSPELLQKINKKQSFSLSKEEKDILAKKLEGYIDKDINNFKNEDELENHNKIPYKDIFYRCPAKASGTTLEKKLAKAMSLYNQFDDPDDSNIVEFRFV